MADRGEPSSDFLPCAYRTHELRTGTKAASLEAFAVNLLSAELRLKSCDSEPAVSDFFDSDCNVVTSIIPELADVIGVIEGRHSSVRSMAFWTGLQTRYHWMVTTFFLWRSRTSNTLQESREAELRAIEHVKLAIECLEEYESRKGQSVLKVIKTPHLSSPRRSALYWKSLSLPSLATFQDEIQAISVVSGGRQKFQEICSRIDEQWKNEPESTISEDDRLALQDIGGALTDRYYSRNGKGDDKLTELRDDFVSSSEDELFETMRLPDVIPTPDRWGSLWDLVPTDSKQLRAVIANPSPNILAILVACEFMCAKDQQPVDDEEDREKRDMDAESVSTRQDNVPMVKTATPPETPHNQTPGQTEDDKQGAIGSDTVTTNSDPSVAPDGKDEQQSKTAESATQPTTENAKPIKDQSLETETSLQDEPASRGSPHLLVARLLTRLVLSIHDEFSELPTSLLAQQPKKEPHNEGREDQLIKSPVQPDGYSSDGSLSREDAEEAVVIVEATKDNTDTLHKALRLGAAADFLTEKILAVSRDLESHEQQALFSDEEFLTMVSSSFSFVGNWHSAIMGRKAPAWGQSFDLGHLRKISKVIDFILTINGKSSDEDFADDAELHEQETGDDGKPFQSPELVRKIETIRFVGLVQILVSQRKSFHEVLRVGSSGRSERQKDCMSRAELVASISTSLATYLEHSCYRRVLPSGDINPSSFLDMLETKDRPNNDMVSPTIASLVETMLYFWRKFASESALVSCSFSDRPFSEVLSVPIATALVSLCGCGAIRPVRLDLPDDYRNQLGLIDFYDSDASAIEEEMDDDDDDDDESRADGGHKAGDTNDPNMEVPKDVDNDTMRSKKTKTQLFRKLCQAIQCVSLVVEDTPETLLASQKGSRIGTSLSFATVVTRVMSFFADILLAKFGPDEMNIQQRLWADEYPYKTRVVGEVLDNTLHKAYRWLYGFILVGHWMNSGKDSTSNANNTGLEDGGQPRSKPGSVFTAAQLYRCIRRSYEGSRRSPPRLALECTLSALPPASETPARTAIKRFLFTSRAGDYTTKAVQSLVSNGSADPSVADCVKSLRDCRARQEGNSYSEDDALLVRRGIATELAKGGMPIVSACSDDSRKASEDRESATQNEKDLATKFFAIMDDVCMNDPLKCKSWMDAAESLRLKAELIADRVGFTNGFMRQDDFSIPSSGGQKQPSNVGTSTSTIGTIPLPQLLDEQEREDRRKLEGWTPSLGMDLSVYISHHWSSFTSLLECSKDVARTYREQTSRHGVTGATDPIENHSDDIYFEAQVWREIETSYRKGNLADWQQSWGALFVQSLRLLTTRCLSVAVHILQTDDESQHTDKKVSQDALAGRETRSSDAPPDESMLSEALEMLGTMMYLSLTASQRYGFPIQSLTDFAKRDIAKTARVCFEHAIRTSEASKTETTDDHQSTWDLDFMIGKVSAGSTLLVLIAVKPGVCQFRFFVFLVKPH